MSRSDQHEPLMPIACSRLKMTVSWRMNLLSLIFTLLATLASTEDTKAGSGRWVHAGSNITLRYDGEESGRYRNLSVMKQGKLVFTLVTACCLAVSAVYELIEWGAAEGMGQGADAFLGTQGYAWDTQSDILMALIGAAVAQVVLAKVQDRQVLKK